MRSVLCGSERHQSYPEGSFQMTHIDETDTPDDADNVIQRRDIAPPGFARSTKSESRQFHRSTEGIAQRCCRAFIDSRAWLSSLAILFPKEILRMSPKNAISLAILMPRRMSARWHPPSFKCGSWVHWQRCRSPAALLPPYQQSVSMPACR